jgi:hypothetical protein
MSYTYYGPGPWGAGKNATYGPPPGNLLSPQEMDLNNWASEQGIAAKAGQGVGIALITLVPGTNNELLIQMTDHSYQSPITIPIAELPFRGNWLPDTPYQIGDLVAVYNGTISATLYQVLFGHTSAGTFDPGANDGLGHSYYLAALTIPSWQAPAVQTQSGTLWTPALPDAWTYNRFTNSLPITVVVPSFADVVFPVGTEIRFRQAGAGQIHFIDDSGVIIHPQDNCLSISSGQGATVTIKNVAVNEWDISGRLEVHA